MHENVLGALFFALFAVLVGTKYKDVGLRNYLFILVLAGLSSTTVVARWLLDSSFFMCCLIGFGIGYLADDVMMNLNATMPEFVGESIREILNYLRNKLRSIFKK